MADPDTVMAPHFEGKAVRMQRLVEQFDAELQAHMAEMDRRIVERLERILSDAHTHRPYRPNQPMEEFPWACGRIVYYDEIERDSVDEGARLEYLKSLVREEPVPEPPRRCPLPKRLERKGRDAECKGRRRRGR